MKWITLIILILLSTMVFAEENVKKTYKPNEIIDLGLHLTNGTGDVIGANCSTQIRNETYGVVDENIMNDIGGGYYNYTYNTSRIGTYFCRQNCTQGNFYDANTCDFIVGGDEKTSISIILMMGIVIAFFFILAGIVKIESIRYLLMAISAFTLILMVNIGMLIAKDELPESVQSLLSTTYLLILYPLEFILGLGIIFLILYHVVKWLPERFKMGKYKQGGK